MNDLQQKLFEMCASSAAELGWNAVKSLKSAIWDRISINAAMSNYAKRYVDRHGEIKVLGMSKPVPLLQIYTEVQTVSTDYLRSMQSIEEMEILFSASGTRTLESYGNSARRPGIDAVNEKQFLNVLGQPGAGKSTFLKRLGLEALLPRQTWSSSFAETFKNMFGCDPADIRYSIFQHENIPVLIELRRFRDETINITSLITNEFDICGFPNPSDFTQEMLREGKLLILLDGLDEVPLHRLTDVIEHIRDFVDRFGYDSGSLEMMTLEQKESKARSGIRLRRQEEQSHNRFVTSCRTAFYKTYFQKFTDVVVADFDHAQIRDFISKWFEMDDKTPGLSEALIVTLYDPSHRATLELASTPLLLTFLCMVYDSSNRFPANRSALYRRALEILLEKWSSEKRVHDDPVYKDLHPEFELQMLAGIAGPAFVANRLFFSKEDLRYEISEFLRDEMQAPKHLNFSRVLEAIEVQQGLIVKRTDAIYSFSHLTIQEYLAAVYFLEAGDIAQYLPAAVSDLRWREVILMFSGMLSKSDDLIEVMSSSSWEGVQENAPARKLIEWIGRVTSGTGSIGLSNRLAAMYYCLCFEMDLEQGRPIDQVFIRARSICHELRIKNGDDTSKFNISGKGKEIDHFKYKINIRKWLPEEVEDLYKYLRSCGLIIDTKIAALRINKIKWEGICNRLLSLQ